MTDTPRRSCVASLVGNGMNIGSDRHLRLTMRVDGLSE